MHNDGRECRHESRYVRTHFIDLPLWLGWEFDLDLVWTFYILYTIYISTQHDGIDYSTLSFFFSLLAGLQALVYKAQYEAAVGNESVQESVYDQMKSWASSHPTVVTVQLCTAQIALMANEVSYAHQLVSSSPSSTHPECMALKVQIYLKIDRIDLAQKELVQLQKTAGEESVLVELCTIYIGLMTGRSIGNDMEHRITTLCEQYGPSVYLLNLLGLAYMVQGNATAAESKLQECQRDFQEEMTPLQKSETLINSCTVTYQQPVKSMVDGPKLVQEILTSAPTYSSIQFQANYERVTMAYDREAVRYMTN